MRRCGHWRSRSPRARNSPVRRGQFAPAGADCGGRRSSSRRAPLPARAWSPPPAGRQWRRCGRRRWRASRWSPSGPVVCCWRCSRPTTGGSASGASRWASRTWVTGAARRRPRSRWRMPRRRSCPSPAHRRGRASRRPSPSPPMGTASTRPTRSPSPRPASGRSWRRGELSDGTPFSADAALEAVATPAVLSVGDPAPHSDNAVAGAAGVPPAAIDSRAASGEPIPDPELHTTSIADALDAGHPALVVFSTPVYCVSQFCGPVTDLVARARRGVRGPRGLHPRRDLPRLRGHRDQPDRARLAADAER